MHLILLASIGPGFIFALCLTFVLLLALDEGITRDEAKDIAGILKAIFAACLLVAVINYLAFRLAP